MAPPVQYRWIGRSQPRQQQAQVIDNQNQQLRWIGVALCLVSAVITVASATLVAVRF
ncbi:MAG: hypothetical protein JNM48_09900 [Rhodospirillales bacterium]|nr:hypothetical protein [Rhodospirillales bacterium]